MFAILEEASCFLFLFSVQFCFSPVTDFKVLYQLEGPDITLMFYCIDLLGPEERVYLVQVSGVLWSPGRPRPTLPGPTLPRPASRFQGCIISDT